MNTYDFDCVILTNGSRGAPHLESLQKSNPGLSVEVIQNPTSSDGWKNCDRNIRKLTTFKDKLLCLEYDVLINTDISNYFGDFDLEGSVFTEEVSGMYGPEYRKLPERFQSHIRILSPLAVVMLSKQALEEIKKSKYDDAFAADVSCMLRLPTILNHVGMSIRSNDMLRNVSYRIAPVIGKRKGIFHPVK